MGGEVEIKTMVSREAVDKTNKKTLEANMERELDMSETSNDEESSTDTESVSTSDNNPAETGAIEEKRTGEWFAFNERLRKLSAQRLIAAKSDERCGS